MAALDQPEPALAEWLASVRSCCEVMLRAPAGNIARVSVSAAIDGLGDVVSAVRAAERVIEAYSLAAEIRVLERTVTIRLNRPGRSEADS